MNITRKSTRGPLGLLLGLWLCCSAAQAQLTAIVAVEPTARKAAHSILRTSAESGLSKAAGQPVALTTSDDLADVMRATRSAGYDIFIGPAQVAASALQRGYELVGATHKSDRYLLVGLQQIAAVPAMKGRRLYLPQQDSVYTYMARGMLNEAGLSFQDLRAVQYEKFPQAGLTALTLGTADATVVREDDWAEWSAAHPGLARVLATSQPVPGGFSIVVKKDLPADARNVRLRLGDANQMLFRSALDDLLAYPYGCVEQTTSSMMPWLAVTARRPAISSRVMTPGLACGSNPVSRSTRPHISVR